MSLRKLLPPLLTALILCLCTACDQLVPIMPGTSLDNGTAVTNREDPSVPTDAFPDRPLYEFMGWDRLGDTYYENTPVALSLRRCGSDGDPGFASPVFDRASIIAACDAMRSMAITDPGQTGGAVTEVYTLTMADGTEYSLYFAGDDLVTSSGSYVVTGTEPLRALTFPAYSSGYDVFDLYRSEDIRAFADNFYQSSVKSVSRRQNQGATFTSRDQDVILQAFSLLAGATVDSVEMNPDQNIDLTQTTDYVFTLSDDSYYTFTFTGPCLTVTVSSAFGPVYYRLGGIDELFALSIMPESTVPAFTGGYVADLREDIRTAVDAANGTGSLTVSGVYVDYTINGSRGYLTLDGAAGAGFLQQVASITATGDAVESPAGDDITISVTLSDGSGPIIYFTGDTVQQMMGSSYPCDSAAMSGLRNTILTLAQDERNIGKITLDSTE